MRSSVCHSWQRLCSKESPSHSCAISPIKPISYHLMSNTEFHQDDAVKVLVWAVLNNEEFFYHNVASLVNYHSTGKANLSMVLRSNMNVVDWHDRLEDKEYLGEGSFGTVFKAKDKVTNETYALKLINSPEKSCVNELFYFLSRLLAERTIMSELNRCIFFVRLIAAFQDVDTKFTFVLEFCLCDLKKLYSFYPHRFNNKKLLKMYKKGTFLKKVARKMRKSLKVDYIDLIFMYFFEMLCGLHYLASRHVVHSDIKPANILISISGHIKIADLGLAYRNHWFDRHAIDELPLNETDIKIANDIDEKESIRGTSYYFDPEIIIQEILDQDNEEKIIDMQKHFRLNIYYLSMLSTSINFLSDLYAVGITFFEICFPGLDLFLKPLLCNGSYKYWPIEIIFDKFIREESLVIPILKMSKDHNAFSVMTLLLSIFQPRQLRGQNFLTDIFIYKQTKLSKEQYIDINKIENTFYYKSKYITKENVTNIQVSNKFLLEIQKPLKSKCLSLVYEDEEEESEDSEENSDGKFSDEEQPEILCHKMHPFEFKYENNN